jgi:uncharacterized lipoprotein NlpE involved in copper resistance
MKNMKLKYYIMLLGVLLMVSCTKVIDLTTPTFDVTTATNTYGVGKPVKFLFTGGDAQIISFYSGETLKNYDFKDGRVVSVADTGATMSFQTSVQVGTQANQVSLLVSTDFNGDYSSLASVKAATWTDITSRFVLGTTATFLASGTKDITDLIVKGKPIYFAYKYLTKPQATNGLVRTWYIQVFAITSLKKLDGTVALPITDQANAGFRIVDENPVNAPALSTITATRITLIGNKYKIATDSLFNPAYSLFNPLNPIYDPRSPSYIATAVRPTYVPFDPASPYNDPQSEHWAVSRAINTGTVNLGPDWSFPLRGITTSSTLTDYTYTYTKAGTYTVTFVASNNSIDAVKKVVKQLTITITP